MDKKSEDLDYPIVECIVQAEILVNKGVRVHQKFTCEKCGSRQTMGEPDMFYNIGKCEECKHETDLFVRGCNYIAIAEGEEAQQALFDFIHNK